MQDLYRNLDLTDLANKVRTFTLNLQDYDMVTPSLAKVVVTLTGNIPTKEEVRAEMAGLFKDLASPVLNSFREIENTGPIRTIVGFVKTCAAVKDFDGKPVEGMRVVASNMLMDEQDKSLWEIRNGATGKYLVLQGDQDLSELAQVMTTRKAGMPTLAHVGNIPTEVREFAAFVDTKAEEVMHGYVVASEGDKLQVIPYGDDEVQTVEASNLVEVRSLDSRDTAEMGLEMAASVQGDRNAMVEYYKKAFQHSPDYIQKLIDMIDAHSFA